ncbi:hypothetical protein [Nostoc linckia]|uniref:hypothetical protein n=1 Tax=Nostoc linckia TaxID=92942 RepID=UPI00117D6BDE|nr:hypothetical protein [Nostoc linckia]
MTLSRFIIVNIFREKNAMFGLLLGLALLAIAVFWFQRQRHRYGEHGGDHRSERRHKHSGRGGCH